MVQIADFGYVSGEQENEKQPPLVPCVEVQDDRRHEQGCALDPKENRGQAIDHAVSTRGLARVRQHADLVMIDRLGQALVRAREVPLAA